MDGIVLIDKPKGITSYDVIRKAKKIFKTNKIGHTGTLDPFASGLLILCVNKATKLADKLTLSNKVYEGTIDFNHHYDTYDVTGKVLNTSTITVEYENLLNIKNKFIGKLKQVPPIYSAIKKDGLKMYQYARKDIEIELEPRNIEIFDLDFFNKDKKNHFDFKVTVSKGTYIRSLAVDIARELNTFAALRELRRVKVSKYDIKDAVSINMLKENDLLSISDIYKDNPKVIVNDYMARLIKNGIYLDQRQIITDESFLVYDNNENLIALYEVISENNYKPVIIF